MDVFAGKTAMYGGRDAIAGVIEQSIINIVSRVTS